MMKGVKPVVLFWALILAKPTFSQPNEATALATLEVTRSGRTATVSVAPVGEDVFLPACRGVSWERFVEGSEGEDGQWITLPGEPCGPAKPPVKVSKDGVQYSSPAFPEGESAVLRAVAAIGLGCAEDRPMALGGCTTLTHQDSKNITIPAEVGG